MQLPRSITEQELIQQCIKGDLKHQELLYRQFYGYAMGVGLRYCINRDDALEVVNDAFIKAFKSIKTYNTALPFKGWLRKIVVNTAIDKQRKEQKHQRHIDIDDAVYLTGPADVVASLDARDILKLLNQLPVLHRAVFNLYEIDGYNHDEIASMLGIAVSSSRVYLGRAKEKLRDAINKEERQV